MSRRRRRNRGRDGRSHLNSGEQETKLTHMIERREPKHQGETIGGEGGREGGSYKEKGLVS